MRFSLDYSIASEIIVVQTSLRKRGKVMTINFNQIGSRVKAVRNRRGISQMDLADKIDKSPTYISYIECGYKSMSLETFVAIANALHVPADELLIDNLDNTIKVANHEFASIVQDCDEYERKVLLEVLGATKQALRQNRSYLSHRR